MFQAQCGGAHRSVVNLCLFSAIVPVGDLAIGAPAVATSPHSATIVLLAMPGVASAGVPRGGSNSDDFRTQVEHAIQQAISAVLREDRLQVADIWNLRNFLKSFPHEELAEYVKKQAQTTPATPYVGLVRNAPPVPLPEDPGRGLVRLGNYLAAPFGEPEARRVEFLRAYLTKNEAGYVLTHQLLVLEWAREMGVTLPGELSGLRDKLLTRIAAEQNADHAFSDLYAERAALLLEFGSPRAEDAEKWIRTIVDAQHADGTWGVLKWTASYDEQTIPVTGTRMHTATLAMAALGAFYDRYLTNEPENSP